jgi:hypothetical protein
MGLVPLQWLWRSLNRYCLKPLCGIDAVQRERSIASNEEAVMATRLPEAVRTAVRNLVQEAERENEILDAYGMAERIKRAFPNEQLGTGELVAEMLGGGPRAIELSPPSLVIEVILPPGTPPEDDTTEVAPMKLVEVT